MALMPAAEDRGISARPARKSRDRFEQEGVEGLMDRSSRPFRTRSSVDAELALVGRSVVTISRLLAGLGLSSLRALDSQAGFGALRTRGTWRAAAHGHQETGAHR